MKRLKVISVLPNGGSNNKKIIKSIPLTKCSSKIINLDLDNIPVAKVLGIIWDPQKDILRMKGVTKNVALTKTISLSFISSTYNPVGLIALATLEPKLIIRDLWTRQIDLDVKLPEDLKLRWTK